MISLTSAPIQRAIQKELQKKVSLMGTPPLLAVVRLGDDDASVLYAKTICKKAKLLGIKVRVFPFSGDTHQQKIISFIQELNTNSEINGIMLQRPLPSRFNEFRLASQVSFRKDVEGIHQENLGKLILNKKTIYPCTAEAAIEILRFYNITTQGKKVVVVGASNIVGKPIANLLIQEDSPFARATVTICNKYTTDISSFTKDADIIFVAVGKAKFLKASMIKQNCTIIDIGISVDKRGRMVGDVDFADCAKKANGITPVPGGVGRLTTMVLFKNLLKAMSL